jgi:hypothetical protein
VEVSGSRRHYQLVEEVSPASRAFAEPLASTPCLLEVATSAQRSALVSGFACQPLDPPPLPFGGCGFGVDFTTHRPVLVLEAPDLDDLLVLLAEPDDLAR